MSEEDKEEDVPEDVSPLEVKIVKEKEVVVEEDINYDDFDITDDEKFDD